MHTNLKPQYQIFIVNAGRDRWMTLLEDAIKERAKVLEIPEAEIALFDESNIEEMNEPAVGKICLAMKAEDSPLGGRQTAFLEAAIKKQVTIIPVCDALTEGKDEFLRQIPENIRIINAFLWEGDDSVRELTSEIFENLSLTERERKVFISYRRSDGGGYADQLFDLLNRSGFRVFKDDYSLRPGVDFQKSLMEELDEMAYLVLVETQESLDSKWVQIEIDYALKKHLGVAVLRFPGMDGKGRTSTAGHASGQSILMIAEEEIETRRNPQGKEMGHFTQVRLDSIKQFIIESHAERLMARNRYFMDSIIEKCRDVGQPFHLDRNWRLVLENFEVGKPVCVGICHRTPRPLDLYLLERSMLGTTMDYGILVHDASNISTEARRLNHWAIRGNVVEMKPLEQFLDQIGDGL